MSIDGKNIFKFCMFFKIRKSSNSAEATFLRPLTAFYFSRKKENKYPKMKNLILNMCIYMRFLFIPQLPSYQIWMSHQKSLASRIQILPLDSCASQVSYQSMHSRYSASQLLCYPYGAKPLNLMYGSNVIYQLKSCYPMTWLNFLFVRDLNSGTSTPPQKEK